MPLDANIDIFVNTYMMKSRKPVAARLQAALALLERLKSVCSLRIDDHLVPKGRAAIISHEAFGAKAHNLFSLIPINNTHGRRSSNIQSWGQPLLDILKLNEFENMNPEQQNELLLKIQSRFVDSLRKILEQDPIILHGRGRSIEAVIHELLKQASEKGKGGDVAQYIVGAKLMLRLARIFHQSS